MENIHGRHGGSPVPRLVILAWHSAALAAAGWLLLGDGYRTVGDWFGARWVAGDPVRRDILFACAALYYVRLSVQGFVLLRRRVGFAEALQVGPFLFAIHVGIAFAGVSMRGHIGIRECVGASLYLFGSYVNTASEWRRHRWKSRPENRGRLYTEGYFALCRHPNYFADVVLFTGYAFVSRSPFALAVPALMAVAFVKHHIPMLERHLQARYGREFAGYRARTRAFVPFLW